MKYFYTPRCYPHLCLTRMSMMMSVMMALILKLIEVSLPMKAKIRGRLCSYIHPYGKAKKVELVKAMMSRRKSKSMASMYQK